MVARASACVDRVSVPGIRPGSEEEDQVRIFADSGGLGRHRDPSELVASHAGDPANFP